jgi:hypothetical protein
VANSRAAIETPCNTRRAIDIHVGDEIDEKALKALVRAALALNESKAKN